MTLCFPESSTATLRSTSTAHDTLSSVLDTSKHLITALEKSDWLDRVLILSAFIFFVLIVLFIVKQRVLDRGLRIAFWWTRFIPDFTSDSELLKTGDIGQGGGISLSDVSVAVTSALSTAASSVATLSLSQALPSSPESSFHDSSESRGPSHLETTFSHVAATSQSTEAFDASLASASPTKGVSDYHANVDEL